MVEERITDKNQFAWLYHMRFYFNSRVQTAVEKLGIKMANADFFYGFEYLGVGEKLV